MATLLIAEHDNASLKDATAKTLAAAAAIGSSLALSSLRPVDSSVWVRASLD